MCSWFLAAAVATYMGSDEAYFKLRGQPAQKTQAPLARVSAGGRCGPASISWEHTSSLTNGRDDGQELLVIEFEFAP